MRWSPLSFTYRWGLAGSWATTAEVRSSMCVGPIVSAGVDGLLPGRRGDDDPVISFCFATVNSAIVADRDSAGLLADGDGDPPVSRGCSPIFARYALYS